MRKPVNKMRDGNRCCAIVVAAGSSSRMKCTDSKIWLPLSGIPAIVRTLMAMEQAETIDEVVVVCRECDIEEMNQMIVQYLFRKHYNIVPGANSRQGSVACGVAAVPPDCSYIAIHDGARPLVRPELIDRVVLDAHSYGASALAILARDTIKKVDEQGFVVDTPPRSQLWNVQTPQVFRRELYESAMKAVSGDYTDDCQLIEQSGGRVHLCEGSPDNIKLTTPEDILFAQAVLISREGGYT
ncbi:MAG: 2-C-methyl-D-erythritol 4-phosphate cytidylyltransferase [Clostridium sp.]|uniref:2-C-methyl-D-erythritol 4-phosphate cytidylyltransferase n=1 Tax=Clostridium sp. TaxID=1506 RepID=UPI00290B4FA7|nr:2-C-methyl-D-erythritol 4-phosphate cytidylyltransferase [Clostridium sp.]MDU7339272.1 2-C-methyl-D-erythritol 4-phosphate cytidylyltransferase [Clostridium sp.]